MSEKDEFGDFEEVADESESSQNSGTEQQMPQRVRLPRNKELIGRITQRLGGNRMDVKTTDGKTRNCRVPGRYKRRLWLRPNDIVIIIPWELDDSKGDVVYKYRPNEVHQLKKKGILDSLSDEF